MSSIYSLDTLKRRNGTRIAVEFFVLFLGVTGVYLVLIEPVLFSVFEDIYVQSGLDYSRTNLPDTPTEVTHLLLTVITGSVYLYIRLNHTERGKTFAREIKQARKRR